MMTLVFSIYTLGMVVALIFSALMFFAGPEEHEDPVSWRIGICVLSGLIWPIVAIVCAWLFIAHNMLKNVLINDKAQ